MRPKLVRTLILVVLLLCASSLLVLAAYSTTGRELVSLGHLEKTFLSKAVKTGNAVLEDRDEEIISAAQAKLDALDTIFSFQSGTLDGSLEQSASLGGGLRFKKDDVITLGPGTSFLLLAGEADVTVVTGTIVDATDGAETQEDMALTPVHRYLTAERTLGRVTILSDTAVLSLEGSYSLTASKNADHNMLADALKSMGLFKGTDTGYGSGYDLERAPTRIEGLIMFLRLLGEEPEALSTTVTCPFTDVPKWAQGYVAYAYAKGYTRGISATAFGPTQQISAAEYLTFVLRALGYQDSGAVQDFSWDTALIKALSLGVINAKEHKQLTEQPFLRAQVVYVSYYALDARMRDTDTTLYTALTTSGALDKAVVDAARQAVTSERIR